MSSQRPKEGTVIGIIGFGVVGKAVGFGFSPIAEVMHFDPASPGSDSLGKISKEADVIFVCVPTPQKEKELKVDTKIMDTVLRGLEELKPKCPVVIKSTLTPDILRECVVLYPSLEILYNPEFLTERTASYDFINQTRILIGSARYTEGSDCTEGVAILRNLYKERFPHTPIHLCSNTEASMVKYMCNSFFSVKLSYFNEWAKIAKKEKANFEKVKNMVFEDYRIGNSHMDVPGPDGSLGWGGKCFPKDTAGAVAYAKRMKMPLKMVEAAREVNVDVRGKQKDPDWVE